jgi:TonB family protein
MTCAAINPRPWSRPRLAAGVGLILILQLALLFWFGERNPIQPQGSPSISAFRQVPIERQQDLVLENPTLFALPAIEGFSGETWLGLPAPKVRPYAWTEEPRWLPLETRQLGAVFSPLVENRTFSIDPVPARPSPELMFPVITREPRFADRSSVTLASGLNGRKLERGLGELPSWSNTELLTDTVVQVAVDAEGSTLSATLLRSCSFRAADKFALEWAMAARFSPAPPQPEEGGPKLSMGQLIFDWHTLAPAATNAPGGAP